MLGQSIRMAILWLATFYLGALSQPVAAHAFPELFRPRFFQQQQPHHQPPEQFLLPASNLLQPVVAFNQFGLRQMPQMQQQQQLHLSTDHHQFHHHQPQKSAYFSQAATAGSGNSAASIPMPVGEHEPELSGVHPMASFHEPATLSLSESSQLSSSGSDGNNIDSTVDKIESHIGDQIEQSLKAGEHQLHGGTAASEYHRQQPSSSAEGNGEQEEPQKSALNNHHHQHHHHHHHQQQQQHKQQQESAVAASGEEPEEVEEPAAEKRSGEKEVEEQQKHEEEHKEQPLEAFEVHHKKGGKSFQYFHQGHQHP